MDNERTQVVTVARNIETGIEERLHCLVLVSGYDVGRRHLVGSAGVTLGRTPPADIVLGDSEVSRLHCRVGVEDEQLIVTDLNSTNGTFVDGKKITGPTALKPGSSLQVGSQSFTHERLTGRQVQKSDELDRDLATANSYVQALLPPPLRDGPIRADWIHLPCAALGGDAFGYGALDANLFVGYLIDVSGHGAGAAMHSVAVMNLLRQRALPNVDMAKPAEVLAALNTMFQMDEHADMYFTIWYGVYDALARRLEFASAGHHPAYLVSADRSTAIGLDAPNLLIGAMPGKTYKADSVSIPPGASLYVFSDGVFEIVTKEGVQWALSDFEALIMEPPQEGVTEPERLFRAVSAASKPGGFDDDFSLVVLTFD